ncbi:protein kinase [Streptomyces sp. NBC_01210]|uniref:phthiocerol/phthiodiolone dimycocerosyl transferase family protein n=1 Tax=Streptomyces sp. NBC_01210 TaxID=2903774 RepID=UPI002E0D84B5|nr:protein kinase [Streptomyces sp. NBC_01210]
MLSCTVRGDIDEKLLAAAFAAKVAQHPPLRSRVRHEGKGYFLETVGETELPRLTVRPNGPSAFTNELNASLPIGGPLVRAVLLRGDIEHKVVLVLDHVITDGHSAIALQHAMWRTYSALVDGTCDTKGNAAESWPPAVTDLLPPWSAKEAEHYLARRTENVRRCPVSLLPYEAACTDIAGHRPRVEVQRVLFESGPTTRLVRLAKAADMSVHGLVSAAFLIAIRRQLGGEAGTRSLGCLSPVDLRSRLTPPLKREAMVPAVSSYLDVLHVAEDTDPLELGREVTANLKSAIDRGDIAREIRILPELVWNPGLMTASVIVTNMGAVDDPLVPNTLDITDVRLIPARDHYYPEAGRGPVMGCVVSFNNRLGIELPYSSECFSHKQIRDLSSSVYTTLLGFLGEDRGR